MIENRHKSNILILSLIVLFLALSIRIYFISQKSGLHVDEMFTISISRCNNYGWLIHPESGVIFRGDTLKKRILNDFSLDKGSSLLQDLKKLRENNFYDKAHPSLYYSLFRIWTINVNNFDLQKIIFYGCSLNLLFFLFSFFIMYKLLIRLFGDNKLVPIGLAAAFLNTGTISMTLFVRPYELQTLSLILLSYIFVIYFEKITRKENMVSIKDCATLLSVLCLGFLSAYFTVIYIFIFGFILIFVAIKNRQFKSLLFLFINVLGALIFAWLIYNGYFDLLGSQRISEARGALMKDTNRLFKNVMVSFGGVIYIYTNFIFYVPIYLILLYCLSRLHRNKKPLTSQITLILVFLVFGGSIAIMSLSELKILRYVAPTFPIVSILIPYSLSLLDKYQRNVCACLVIGIYIVYAILATSIEGNDTDIKSPSSQIIPFGAKIQNLSLTDYNFKSVRDSGLPVIVVYHYWLEYLYIIPHLDDKQIYIMMNLSALKNPQLEVNNLFEKYRHCYLLRTKEVPILPNNKKIKVLKSFNCNHFTCNELMLK